MSATNANRWRRESRRLIEETIATALAEQPELVGDLAALFALVSKAYPAGERKHHQYRIWLEEVRRARARFEPLTYSEEPLDRPCPSCGAGRGRACRPIGDDDPIAAELLVIGDAAPRGRGRKAIALSLAADVVHAARRETHGPLFAAGGSK